MPYELVMYVRTIGCPFVNLARGVLRSERVPYREINIDRVGAAKTWLLDQVGYLSVPTLVVAEEGTRIPYIPPSALPPNTSPRGIDRGTLITEPSAEQLTAWLHKHHFLGNDQD